MLKRAPRVSRFTAIYTCTIYTFDSHRVAESAAYYRKEGLAILDDVAQ